MRTSAALDLPFRSHKCIPDRLAEARKATLRLTLLAHRTHLGDGVGPAGRPAGGLEVEDDERHELQRH